MLLGKKKIIKNVNSVVDYFKNNNLLIILVKQAGVGNLYDKLHFTQSDYVITKSKPSSFSSEEFCNIVNKLTPNEFVVTGLMSNACVQETCKSALPKDFKVTLIEDGQDSIIKPFRAIFNKHLKNKGATVIKCSDFILDK